MRLSALGVFIGVCPEWDGPRRRWLCVGFGKCGHWQSMSVHDCEASAIKARSKLYRHHRNLNAEREMRRSKRSRTKTADHAPQGRKEQQ